tara:strand:- start:1171 stop:1395 length:225 start_codon:yes stop_codon:yes gene_type:complete
MTGLTFTQTKTMINENFKIRKEINGVKGRLEGILDREHVDAVTINSIQREIDRMEEVIYQNNVIMSTIVTNWDK